MQPSSYLRHSLSHSLSLSHHHLSLSLSSFLERRVTTPHDITLISLFAPPTTFPSLRAIVGSLLHPASRSPLFGSLSTSSSSSLSLSLSDSFSLSHTDTHIMISTRKERERGLSGAFKPSLRRSLAPSSSLSLSLSLPRVSHIRRPALVPRESEERARERASERPRPTRVTSHRKTLHYITLRYIT